VSHPRRVFGVRSCSCFAAPACCSVSVAELPSRDFMYNVYLQTGNVQRLRELASQTPNLLFVFIVKNNNKTTTTTGIVLHDDGAANPHHSQDLPPVLLSFVQAIIIPRKRKWVLLDEILRNVISLSRDSDPKSYSRRKTVKIKAHVSKRNPLVSNPISHDIKNLQGQQV
jgi:hypothetical protein